MFSSSGDKLYEQSTFAKSFKRSRPAAPSFSATKIVGFEDREEDTMMKWRREVWRVFGFRVKVVGSLVRDDRVFGLRGFDEMKDDEDVAAAIVGVFGYGFNGVGVMDDEIKG